MLWTYLLALQFLMVVVGFFSHCVLLFVLVVKDVLELYTRIGLAVLSVSMMLVLQLYGLEMIVCLGAGTMFEDETCTSKETKFLLLCIREYFQMVTYLTQLLFTVERILTIEAPEFHKSLTFKKMFQRALLCIQLLSLFYTLSNNFYASTFSRCWLIVTHLLIISNWPMLVYAKKACRRMYKKDVTFYDLERKHELYKLYEVTKSLVSALIISAVQQLITFVFVGLQYAHRLFPYSDSYKMLFILHILWNLNLVVFPWAVLVTHRASRSKILASHQEKPSITSLDGTEITPNPSQNDYFRELKVAWA